MKQLKDGCRITNHSWELMKPQNVNMIKGIWTNYAGKQKLGETALVVIMQQKLRITANEPWITENNRGFDQQWSKKFYDHCVIKAN